MHVESSFRCSGFPCDPCHTVLRTHKLNGLARTPSGTATSPARRSSLFRTSMSLPIGDGATNLKELAKNPGAWKDRRRFSEGDGPNEAADWAKSRRWSSPLPMHARRMRGFRYVARLSPFACLIVRLRHGLPGAFPHSRALGPAIGRSPKPLELQRKEPLRWNECSGSSGADGNRNHDLFDANEALYQLSYSPVDVVVLRMTTRLTIPAVVNKCKSRVSRRRVGHVSTIFDNRPVVMEHRVETR